MDVLIPILLLLGLLAWIIFDRMWILRRPTTVSKEAGWSSSEFAFKHARRFCIGMALVMYFLALAKWIQPSHPPFTGKFAAIETALYQSYGPISPAIFMAVLASVLLVLALLRKKVSSK
jgi:hypothetical protein